MLTKTIFMAKEIVTILVGLTIFLPLSYHDFVRYSVNKDVVRWRILDDEAVLIHTETSSYYGLNKTGTFIWNLILDKQMSLEDIVESMSSYYQEEQEDIIGDIKSVLDNLLDENLIKGSG